MIKTASGKDFKINAVSGKEKEDWMVQINCVKRCYLMRQRAFNHILHKNYRAVAPLSPHHTGARAHLGGAQ